MCTNEEREFYYSKMPQYLQKRGTDISKSFRCLSGTHEDKKPSMGYNDKDKKVHCFSCGINYDIFDLIGMDYSLKKFNDQVSRAKQLFGEYEVKEPRKASPKLTNANPASELMEVNFALEHKEASPVPKPEKNFEGYCASMHENIGKTDYLASRGLSETSAKRFNLGYDERYKLGKAEYKALIIPTSSTSYVARIINPSYEDIRYSKCGSSHFLNIDALDNSEQPIFVVEGEIDALSIIELGGEAISLGSVTNWKSFADTVLKRKPSQPLILALDNDKAGSNVESELLDKLNAEGISVSAKNIYGSCKDANEALLSDRGGFKATLEEEKETALNSPEVNEYRTKSDAAFIPHFIENGQHGKYDLISETGFSGLDEVLGGGIYEGLHILGAPSSLGKTTFVSQLASNIASQDYKKRDILWFNLEMQKSQMMAVYLSRVSRQLSAKEGNVIEGFSSREVMSLNKFDMHEKIFFEKVCEVHKETAKHIFSLDEEKRVTAEDIKKKTEEHYRLTGQAPIVVVDYLQLVAPPDSSSMNEKQGVDNTLLVLKGICDKYHTAVIAISSVNREAYDVRGTEKSFKESGTIEFTGEVLMALQYVGVGKRDFDVEKAKRKIPREVQLSIMKSRFGLVGESICFQYYAKYNLFVELPAVA